MIKTSFTQLGKYGQGSMLEGAEKGVGRALL